MKKSFVAIAAGLLAAVAVATIALTAREPEQVAAPGVDPGDYFDQSAATEDRLRALEVAVAEERDARHLLEDEMQNIYSEIERLTYGPNQEDEQAVARIRESNERRDAFLQQRYDQTNEGRTARLVEAGFSPDRAAWILQRESELQMQSMQAQFDARRSGQPLDRFDPRLDPILALRTEIGDAQYEQYLQANYQPTAVSIGSVLESSPGQRAGLQPGDEIVRYDGTRVFNVSDLNRQTMLGEPGESVVVDITRDGIPMQLVLPRGPIGVSTGRLGGRR
jgi:C-terminal processing protease CtpA/Prc